MDLEDAYVTYTNEYVESVWWILKSLWEKDLLYKSYKVVPYCPRDETPLSDHEVAQGYDKPPIPRSSSASRLWRRTIFRFSSGPPRPGRFPAMWLSLLIRTWSMSLSSESMMAEREAHPRQGSGREGLPRRRSEDPRYLQGPKLKGQKYRPLFTFLPPHKPAYFVVMGDFVTTEDGTGLVHMAPAFGAEDMQMAIEHDLPILMTVLPDGTFVPEVTPWRGVFIKDADHQIIEDLRARGLLFRHEAYTHTYPFCWRCGTPLMYYARNSWYIRTSKFKDRLVELNNTINWVPDHIREGRFGNWLENNIDWALSRERYWGTPLPVWECADCKHRDCIGSIQELSDKTGRDLSDLDLHRPYVDAVMYPCPECGGEMVRVLDLIDVWFDSGSMPYAQWHYPFENQDKFKSQFPADYICEAVDQTRGWFYSLHAISTLLMDSVAYKNVLCLGLILDGDGKKMSKSLGNIVNPWDVIKVDGVDAFRWYLYTATPPGNERRFSVELVSEVIRNFTLTLWNVYSFFVTYANLDKPDLDTIRPHGTNILDR